MTMSIDLKTKKFCFFMFVFLNICLIDGLIDLFIDLFTV